MKIDLSTANSKRDIVSVRSQITDGTSLKKFDDFVAKNRTFDFNNDEHLRALKKSDCHCTVSVPVTLSGI